MININTTYLYYIKNPVTPILDYYVDVNGNYQYLSASEEHKWATGEKDSSGNTHTYGDQNYTSTTVELEWKDQDKLDIVSRILSLMGVNLDSGEIMQYAQELKLNV